MKALIVAIAVFGIVPGLNPTISIAEERVSEERARLADEVELGSLEKERKWAEKGAGVLNTVMKAPESAIPDALLKKAKCVAVFPSVVKVGLIVGARHGEGLMSCRNKETKEFGAPAFFGINGASFGLQAGVGAVDLVMLIMNEQGLEGLMKTTLRLGADAGVAVGPVGREASVSSDILLKSSIVTYSRAKGVYAGANLEGSVIRYSKKANKEIYGEELSAEEVLLKRRDIPAALQAYTDAVKTHTAVKKS